MEVNWSDDIFDVLIEVIYCFWASYYKVCKEFCSVVLIQAYQNWFNQGFCFFLHFSEALAWC